MEPSPESKSRLRPKTAATDLWRNTLAQIPSLLGRLIYLSTLRDFNTGSYHHHGLATVYGEEEANNAMRLSHQDTFAQWLEFPLEQQKADLELYVAGLEPERKRVVETWSRIEPYRTISPSSASPLEKQLFLTDLETLLTLMRNELGVASPDPTAWPHP
ncbi:MAG: hypothetical protein JNK48_28750 [Bryobacterales bacterium]|nr:hypothetical protein [Bryobacterales bacterium]